MLQCLTANKNEMWTYLLSEIEEHRESVCCWDDKGDVSGEDNFTLPIKSHQTQGLGGLGQTHSYS